MAVKAEPDYIDLLNKAVSRELQVSIQYILQHAKIEKLIRKVTPENILLEKTTYEAIGEFLKEFAIQEMKHAAAIMERIYLIGGSATTKANNPIIGGTLKGFMIKGFEAEEEALILYRQIIKASKGAGDWETRKLLQKIFAEEEVHLYKFQQYLNIEEEPEETSSPTSKWREIFTDDYFTLLNGAVAKEISAIIQYTNQHEKANSLALRERISGIEVITESNKAKKVSELLKEVFMQEMEHLEKISERIYLLEGEVTTKPDPLPKVGNNTEDFLKLDHEAENDAIVFYRRIIVESLRLGDTTTRNIFQDIIMQEEEHYWKFDDYLK